jgi:polysaccharide export outer membrane protein
MLNRRRFMEISGLLGLGGCAVFRAPGGGLPALPVSQNSLYRLGDGDQLEIRIFGQPTLSGSYAVDDSGNVDMPLLGLVLAAGKTTDGLAAGIADGFKSKDLILNPSVAVEVTQYRPFYILGEVNTPGQYPFRPGMTVLTAVSIAGGFTYRAVEDYAGITRNDGNSPAQFRAPTYALAEPGDVITVFERRF